MSKIKIDATLDDQAFSIGDFIQELGNVQEMYFNRLLEKVKKEKYVEGLTDEQLNDWLFDYCFNGWREGEYKELFSEYFSRITKEEIEYK
jgi:hypothetical protein